jgi:hypothetical protein
MKEGRDWLLVSTEKITAIDGSADADVKPPPPRHEHPYDAYKKRLIELRDKYGYGRHAVRELLKELPPPPDGPSREWVYKFLVPYSSQTDKPKKK